MEVIIMTNGQNGLSGFERNGNLICNCSWKPYSSHGPLNSWRPPIFGVPLKSKCGKAIRVAGLRVKALQKDESDNRLVGSGGVIEKELEFKPSFGEYLKAMETVKTGREKNQVNKSNSYKLKDDLEGNDAPLLERDERSVKLRAFKDRVKVSKVMESDEFGSNANGPGGEEDVVNAELDYRGRGIREFNHEVGGKESHVHAKRGGATSDEQWLRNSTRSSNSDLEDLNYRSYKLKDDLEVSDAPSSVRHERSVNLRRSSNREKVSGVMESDEFGDSGDGCSGQEDVVNAELDYRGGKIREFNYKVGGKESRVHANVRRRMGGGASDEHRLRNSTRSMNSDLVDLNYRSYNMKGDLEESYAPSLVTNENSVSLRRFNNREKVTGVMESDEFGDTGYGCSGQEDVVNTEFDYRGRRIREFNHKVGEKVSGVHADIRRKMGGEMSDGRWLRDHTSSMNSDSENFNETKSMKTRIAQRSPMVLDYIENIDRTIGIKENLARAKDSLEADKITDRRYVQKSRLSRSSDQAFLERGHGEDFEVERAAFKSFEQSNDVIGKTKVPMWKIEEKIQKLGNWLNGADIDMPEWMFSKAMRSARVKFTDHSVLRIIQILGKLGNWRRVLQVIEWLNIRERYKSHRLRHVYTTALHVLSKAKRPVEALNLFRAMQQEMCLYPDLVAYRSIAVTLGQAGYMKELFDVIDSMRSPPKKFKSGALGKRDLGLEPDTVVYNAVLNACVRRKQWEGAFWVLKQMKEKGLQPSTATYGLVMEVMLACGKYNLVHEFFKKVQKSSIPDALAYKVLVNTFWREGKTEEAVLAVKDMERRGIVGSAALYYDLARCLCTSGRCQEALDLIEKICKVANKPLVVTYTGLIQACLDSGNIQNAVYIFNQMRNFCPPNLVTCNIMLKAYVEHGLFEEAHELFNKMLDDGNHISRRSDYKFRVIPDTYTFNTMLDASIAENRWDDFEYFYEKMLHHGFHFNSNRHLRMVLDASRAGKGEVLEMTWKHLLQEDRIPPPPLVKERFCIMLEKEDFDSALACITPNSAGESQAFCKSAWLNLFEEKAQRFRKDTLIRLMHEARVVAARSNSPNPVLQNLLISCCDYNRPRVKVPGFNQT
ncbi:hypothetical protein SADUNF_Sadunf16G0302100 [Salix dunnii]|uniref:Pentatricopeptide repeat-containing protein n=1 Tax=Salix dunnii TaxID=1413687 RepID=A0A835JF06_9ROSI|nr:hypothetical protein SADUNF_Sadunf16G0302100 [Salix dunnii]